MEFADILLLLVFFLVMWGFSLFVVEIAWFIKHGWDGEEQKPASEVADILIRQLEDEASKRSQTPI